MLGASLDFPDLEGAEQRGRSQCCDHFARAGKARVARLGERVGSSLWPSTWREMAARDTLRGGLESEIFEVSKSPFRPYLSLELNGLSDTP